MCCNKHIYFARLFLLPIGEDDSKNVITDIDQLLMEAEADEKLQYEANPANAISPDGDKPKSGDNKLDRRQGRTDSKISREGRKKQKRRSRSGSRRSGGRPKKARRQRSTSSSSSSSTDSSRGTCSPQGV